MKQTTPDSLRLRFDALGTSIEKEKDEEEEEEDEENLEKEEGEEEQEEHSDLLACRPCGLVFANAWGLKDHQNTWMSRRRTSRQEMQERRRWARRHLRLRIGMLS